MFCCMVFATQVWCFVAWLSSKFQKKGFMVVRTHALSFNSLLLDQFMLQWIQPPRLSGVWRFFGRQVKFARKKGVMALPAVPQRGRERDYSSCASSEIWTSLYAHRFYTGKNGRNVMGCRWSGRCLASVESWLILMWLGEVVLSVQGAGCMLSSTPLQKIFGVRRWKRRWPSQNQCHQVQSGSVALGVNRPLVALYILLANDGRFVKHTPKTFKSVVMW